MNANTEIMVVNKLPFVILVYSSILLIDGVESFQPWGPWLQLID